MLQYNVKMSPNSKGNYDHTIIKRTKTIDKSEIEKVSKTSFDRVQRGGGETDLTKLFLNGWCRRWAICKTLSKVSR